MAAKLGVHEGDTAIDRVREATGGALAEFLEELVEGFDGSTRAIKTELHELDDTLAGGLLAWLRRGQLALLAGVSSVGISTLVLGFARSAALAQGLPTLMLAPNSSHRELICRVVAAETRVPFNDLLRGRVSADHWRKIKPKRAALEAAPLVICARWSNNWEGRLGEEVEGYAKLWPGPRSDSCAYTVPSMPI